MQSPNENGVYREFVIHELARRGRSFAAVRVAQCEDGLYRFSIDFQYSYGGWCGPITDETDGFRTESEAKDAGAAKLLSRWPMAAHDPDHVQAELRELKAQIERRVREPTLF